MSRNLIRQKNQPLLLFKFNKNPFDLPSTVKGRSKDYVLLKHPPATKQLNRLSCVSLLPD